MSAIVRSLRALGYACVALFLSACSETPKVLKPLSDYQTRVASTLDREPIAYSTVPYPRLPDVRALRVEVPRVSVSLLDSWRLDQCAAGQLIAQRNSALGKLEEGISRYFSDRQLTQALRTCIVELERANEPQLAQRLQQAYSEKNATLANSRQLAIATDDALRHTLRIGAETHRRADDAALATVLAAFDRVLSVLTEQPNATSQVTRSELERALEQLHQSDYLPRLWRSMHMLTAYLQQLTPLITELARDAGCYSAGRPARAEVLHTVFLKFFIQEVQSQLAGFTRQGYLVNERLERLLSLAEQPALRTYVAQLIALTEGLNQQSKLHVQPWQTFFEACAFTPG